MEGFQKPIVAPFLFEDPFITTGIYPYYVCHEFPRSSVFRGGDIHVAAVQLRVAITDRVAFIATKDGHAWLRPDLPLLDNREGWSSGTSTPTTGWRAASSPSSSGAPSIGSAPATAGWASGSDGTTIPLSTAQDALGTGGFEGADVMNLGSRGVSGQDLHAWAVGTHVPLTRRLVLSAAYERAVGSSDRGIFKQRVTTSLRLEF